MTDTTIYPRCHPYWIIAYTATGHLLPCCWMDHYNHNPESKVDQFITDELKVENNNSIEDIITSDTWTNFHKGLIDDPDNAPKMCKNMCTHNPTKHVRNKRNAS